MSQIKLKHSGGNSVIIAAPDSNPASDRTLKLPSDGDGTILTTNSPTGKVLKIVHKMDGTRSSTTAHVPANGFTSGAELSNLTLTITPSNATTIFRITGCIYVTHSPSYMGKGFITRQISGGSEEMIAGDGDTGHRATFPISDGSAGTGFTGTAKTFDLIFDHNTTNAVTFRVRVGTSNTGYPVFVNRDQDNNTSDADGLSMISSLVVTEYVGSAVTASENTIYRGT